MTGAPGPRFMHRKWRIPGAIRADLQHPGSRTVSLSALVYQVEIHRLPGSSCDPTFLGSDGPKPVKHGDGRWVKTGGPWLTEHEANQRLGTSK